MKAFTFLSVFSFYFLVFTPAFAQLLQRGNGTVTTEKRPVDAFDAIRSEKGIDLYITQGNAYNLQIEADENLLEHITTQVRNGVLEISHTGNFIKSKGLKAYVTVKTLQSVEISGGADVYTQNTLKANELTCIARGGSDLKMDLDVNKLTLDLRSGSDASLSGRANTFRAEAHGGSDISAKALQTENCHIKAHGGSDASVHSTKEIAIEASGGSDVSYTGGAKVTSLSASGSSDVRKR